MKDSTLILVYILTHFELSLHFVNILNNSVASNFMIKKPDFLGVYQPRSQGFSLFVIGKAGKGPGTGRSSMYSDWSMTSTLLCK